MDLIDLIEIVSGHSLYKGHACLCRQRYFFFELPTVNLIAYAM